jgi:hypothetical protein
VGQIGMDRPDIIVLVVNFGKTEKFRTQVAAKDFILGQPASGKKGELEQEVTNIACYKFSLIKLPVVDGHGSFSRARGAVGIFDYLGNTNEVEATMARIREVWGKVANHDAFQDSDIEVYVGQKWSQ